MQCPLGSLPPKVREPRAAPSSGGPGWRPTPGRPQASRQGSGPCQPDPGPCTVPAKLPAATFPPCQHRWQPGRPTAAPIGWRGAGSTNGRAAGLSYEGPVVERPSWCYRSKQWELIKRLQDALGAQHGDLGEPSYLHLSRSLSRPDMQAQFGWPLQETCLELLPSQNCQTADKYSPLEPASSIISEGENQSLNCLPT